MPQINSKKPLKKTKQAGKLKRKKTKFRKVAFKLTDAQRKALDNYCHINNTTPVRFIKTLINKRVERYRDKKHEEQHITHNQLSLFDAKESSNQK